MSFERCILTFCDFFLKQRTFDLIVAPALADLEFEEAGGRRAWLANRAAVVRAAVGGAVYDALQGTSGFFKLSLLSISYFMFPVALSVNLFATWFEFLLAAAGVLVLAMIPVMVCFWPERQRVRHGEWTSAD